MLRHFMLCCAVLCQARLGYTMLCCGMVCYVMLCADVLCLLAEYMSSSGMSCYIMLCHIIVSVFWYPALCCAMLWYAAL